MLQVCSQQVVHWLVLPLISHLSSGAIHSLLDKNLIRICDRGESIGRPFLYATTPDFLRYLGLEKLEDLPPIDSFEKKV